MSFVCIFGPNSWMTSSASVSTNCPKKTNTIIDDRVLVVVVVVVVGHFRRRWWRRQMASARHIFATLRLSTEEAVLRRRCWRLLIARSGSLLLACVPSRRACRRVHCQCRLGEPGAGRGMRREIRTFSFVLCHHHHHQQRQQHCWRWRTIIEWSPFPSMKQNKNNQYLGILEYFLENNLFLKDQIWANFLLNQIFLNKIWVNCLKCLFNF